MDLLSIIQAPPFLFISVSRDIPPFHEACACARTPCSAPAILTWSSVSAETAPRFSLVLHRLVSLLASLSSLSAYPLLSHLVLNSPWRTFPKSFLIQQSHSCPRGCPICVLCRNPDSLCHCLVHVRLLGAADPAYIIGIVTVYSDSLLYCGILGNNYVPRT